MPAVFFDFDGTLVDTRADLAATVNHTRRDLGLAPWPTDRVIEHVGRGARYLLEHAIPEAAVPYDELWGVFRSHYAEHCCEALTPYPGVPETLAILVERGYRLGINTNKPNFAVRRILAKFGWTDLFGAAVVAGGDGVPLKPDPESLRVCARRLGHTLGADDVMLGDNWTDMACAARVGIRGVFCAFGFGRLHDDPLSGRLDSFPQLLDFLDRKTGDLLHY